MDRKRILFVGLQIEEIQAIKKGLDYDYLTVVYDMLPEVKLQENILYVENPNVPQQFLKVDKVIFHGIYENDFDFITLLALWNGPCLPNATAMMDLRKRIPGLVRALSVTKFGGIKRGMSIGQQEIKVNNESVAKWGVWHCGEDKEKFNGSWKSKDTSVIEEFIDGDAVRIMIIGHKYWQIKLTGDSWLKSIHNEGSWEMDLDKELLEDSQNIANHFNIQMVGVDYIVGKDGQKYLLEVNHIPNVTVFPFVNDEFIKYAINWILN